MASVLPNAALEISEQFVLLFYMYVPLGNFSLLEFARYRGGSRNFEGGCTPKKGGGGGERGISEKGKEPKKLYPF
jgi:hypothetical protein